MKRCSPTLALTAIAALAMPVITRAQIYQTVDPPDTEQTQPFGARDGTVVGIYQDLQGGSHGFSFKRNGAYTSFDAPGSDPHFGTYGIGLDGDCNIVGYFYERAGKSHGFSRSPNGKIVTFDAGGPNAFGLTLVAAVNASGTIVGTYVDVRGSLRGFMRTADGKLSPVNVDSSETTQPTAINDRGDIVGYYVGAGGTQSGSFIRKAGEPFQTIEAPTGCGSYAYVNNRGDVATNCDSNDFAHGYVLSHTGVGTVFDYPGAQFTTIVGISANGDTAGVYLASGVLHGFIRSSAGSFTSIDFPASGVTSTRVNGVDKDGDIFGTYTVGFGPVHGFVRYRTR